MGKFGIRCLSLLAFLLMSRMSPASSNNDASAGESGAPLNGSSARATGNDATQDGGEGIGEIVVTAQKREERLSDVPESINVATGDQLEKMGVTGPADLVKLVPGFTYTPSTYGTPVYTIRGIGFYNQAVTVAPTVSVYVDQVPVPYSAETLGVSFDLDRVEVLKGPQGTLFGQNSTGGAINYIAAKPTKDFEAGVEAGYGNYNATTFEGFVSGPLSSTLDGRIAVRTEERDGWQESQTRDDTLGHRNFNTGRAILDWTPDDALRFELNVNGWIDRSDTQAAQFVLFSPTSPNGYTNLFPQLQAYQPAPNNDRIADWYPNYSFQSDDHFGQVSLRADWDLAKDVALTSITAWSDFDQLAPIDTDGTDTDNLIQTLRTHIRSVSQELRLAGTLEERLHWMVGANYEADSTKDDQLTHYTASNSGIGELRFTNVGIENHQSVDTRSAFASLDYQLSHTLTAQASARYTRADDHFTGCLRDTGAGDLAAAFSQLQPPGSPPIAPGGCVTLSPTTGLAVPIVDDTLNQSNVSWRGNISWKPVEEDIFYFNITRGFKAGSFPTIPALTPSQENPIPQESVLAYEPGFRVLLLDRVLQVSGAAFLYKYRDKQLNGYVPTALGNLPGLVSIPDSSVRGAEFNVNWRPIGGLVLSVGGTFVDSRVDSDFTSNSPYNELVNIKGEEFPNTPKWQFVTDAQYDFSISDRLRAFIGAGDRLVSASQASFGQAPDFRISPYSLLDLRAGIEDSHGKWRVELWGHNVTDRFYVMTVTHVADTVARVTGMPATYGLTLSYRF